MESRWNEDKEEAATVKKWWGRAVVEWGGEASLQTALKKRASLGAGGWFEFRISAFVILH